MNWLRTRRVVRWCRNELRRFGAIFLVQMPVMDGMRATAVIRALETRTVNHLPIIATTFRAMKGYARRCLDARTDGI